MPTVTQSVPDWKERAKATARDRAAAEAEARNDERQRELARLARSMRGALVSCNVLELEGDPLTPRAFEIAYDEKWIIVDVDGVHFKWTEYREGHFLTIVFERAGVGPIEAPAIGGITDAASLGRALEEAGL